MSDEEDDLLAAEYVLGTLHPDERTLYASVLAHNEAARQAVVAWEERLALLSGAVPEVSPPPQAWRRIQTALLQPQHTSFAAAEADEGLEAEIAALQSASNSWRAGALALAAVAAILAIFALDRGLVDGRLPAPLFVSVLNRDGDPPALIIHVDLASGRIFIRPVTAEAPAGKSLELWCISAGKAPRSMGVVSKDPVRLPIPHGISVYGASFEVTVEPKGGSPNGRPSGPIVYSGRLFKE